MNYTAKLNQKEAQKYAFRLFIIFEKKIWWG